MTKLKKNLSESVFQRLRNHAKNTQRRVDEIFRYYAMERFLFRLSISEYNSRFFLKGGLMLKALDISEHRPTLDIDLLSKTSNNVLFLKRLIEEICEEEVISDGIYYNTDEITLNEIQVDGEYNGIRVSFIANLHSAVIPIRIDVGYSDIISPEPIRIIFPTILDFPSPKLLGYSLESVIAEKFHAMIKLGSINTRLKDFFDVWILIRQFSFKGESFQGSIRKTFINRKTLLSNLPDSFSKDFYSSNNNQTQWKHFLRNIQYKEDQVELSNVIHDISSFFRPIIDMEIGKKVLEKSWSFSNKWH